MNLRINQESVTKLPAATIEDIIPFRGLAPFLRWSIAGVDLRPIAQQLLDGACLHIDDADWLMNLSLVLQAMSQREMGLQFLQQALEVSRVYRIAARHRPQVRVLSLMFPGDIAFNTPLDCLLESGDVEIYQYFLDREELFIDPIPDHDICYLAFSESDELQPAIDELAELLERWPTLVMNRAECIRNTNRVRTSQVLQNLPGVRAALVERITRTQLIAQCEQLQTQSAANETFVRRIIRPMGTHAGVGLERVTSASELASYLETNYADEYYVAPFIDYSGADGFYRKYRIALINGVPCACHMALSKDWMIHYVNAGMYSEAWKREHEAEFFAEFETFAHRHATAFAAVHQQIGLDYFCIDCGETKSGELLIFEADHCMVVHDMDSAELFPYKSQQMQKVRDTFRSYLAAKVELPQQRSSKSETPPAANMLNFSGGPGVLPESVLQQVSEAIHAVPDVGLSILGISHRSDWFAQLVANLERDLCGLLQIPEGYRVLFLQGGATQQFSMIPLTLLRESDQFAEYLHTGYWSGKSIDEAQRMGHVRVLWNGNRCGYSRVPAPIELLYSPDAAYFHYVSNETVEGLQFHQLMGLDNVPRVVDMSSDFLCRPVDANSFTILYAHAQKNLGPAGVTVVVLREEVLESIDNTLPAVLDYRNHARDNSIYNTPPVFAIYVTHLVVRWLIEEIGGLDEMHRINRQKSSLIYQLIDSSDGFFHSAVASNSRSLMNVTFGLRNEPEEQRFLDAAEAVGFSGLRGHRSVGGIRASLYNAMPLTSVEYLANFLEDYQFQSRRRKRSA